MRTWTGEAEERLRSAFREAALGTGPRPRTFKHFLDNSVDPPCNLEGQRSLLLEEKEKQGRQEDHPT